MQVRRGGQSDDGQTICVFFTKEEGAYVSIELWRCTDSVVKYTRANLGE